jgi:hypothetical protein
MVKVTGRQSAAQDPTMQPLFAEASRFVQQFRATNVGQILVQFDAAAIDHWLLEHSQSAWDRDRPLTFVWLAVAGGKGTGSVVTRGDSPDIRRSVDNEASIRGIQLRWPSADELNANHLGYAEVVAGPSAKLAEVGRTLGGDGVLIGHANGVAANAGVKWTFVRAGRSAEFTGNVEGVDRAADNYLEQRPAGGAPEAVVFDVEGIKDLRSYASTQVYLESLSVVSRLEVLGLDGQTVHLKLSARGGAPALQRAIADEDRLESLATGAEGGALRFRLRR